MAPAFVVAVGAAAGALDALRTLFGGMPRDTGAVFVVAVHEFPGSVAGLVEQVAPYTHLPVREARGDTRLEPNTVFIVSPGLRAKRLDGRLRLVAVARGAADAERMPVDDLFQAVAATGERAIGIILTGDGSDGVLGLGDIRDGGGLTMAQPPAEADSPWTPGLAIDCGLVDIVSPLRDMPAAVQRYCRTEPGALPEEDSEQERELLAVLAAQTENDVSGYRGAVVSRYVAKRMRALGIERFASYLARLRDEPDEAAALVNDVVSSTSRFFGDAAVFARLERNVLPGLLDRNAAPDDALRAWVVGCGAGEDAYSLAMAALEARSRREHGGRIQLFASDASGEALQRARLGHYPKPIERSVSRGRLASFFMPLGDAGYRVRPELRDLVVFARHDVAHDIPYSRLDLIVCCGRLLERLRPAVKDTVLANFHFALRPHGMLVVDPMAGPLDASDLFVAAGEGGVYRRGAGAGLRATLPRLRVGRAAAGSSRATPAFDARSAHLAALEHYAPASVLVDASDRVIHYSARAGRLLRLPGGEVTHDILRLLREPLRSAVRAGLEVADERSTTWVSDALLVPAERGVRRVVVHVEPLGPLELKGGAKLVVFEEVAAGESVDEADRMHHAAGLTARIELDLNQVRRRLGALVARSPSAEQPEAGEGDARAQLRQALDDVETARKELASVNEALVGLDQAGAVRLEELSRLSADLEVLLESTGLATLFVDRELKVVRFTAPLLEVFHALPADKGRPLDELRHRLRDYALIDDVRRVLRHAVPLEREVEADNGKWYLLRMLPYRSAPQGLGGVAITLVDITTRMNAELAIREADRRKDEFIALLAHELRNPLAPINTGIEILKRPNVDRAVAERVTQTMARQAAQLVRLIDDLLDVSRVRSGRLQLRKGIVALEEVVRDAVAAVRPSIDRAGHQLAIDVHEAMRLEADAARLTQVLANLLSNAARYTPPGGRIHVTARRDGQSAVITVRDSGVGIPFDALPHVFEMFYQGADARATTQTGLGIGLALAKSLVEMHGGAINVESDGLDRGSQFTVRLPVLEPAESREPAAHAHDSTPLGGHRVLVVDDNADAARTLAMLIEALGENDVHVALSGAEALPLAERIRPDTVFLDLKMPHMDGYEVAERLRREPWCEDAWLVALTGWGLEDHKRRAQEAGFNQHLTKPADQKALESILARPVGRAH